MSRDDRGKRPAFVEYVFPVVAFLLVVGIAAGLGFSAHVEQQQQEEITGPERAADYAKHKRQSEMDRAGVLGLAEQFISNPEPGDSAEKEKRDLAAQEATAVWAFWMVFLSGGQLVLSGFGLWALLVTIRQGQEGVAAAQSSAEVAYRSYHIAADANAISRETMERQLRPYVYLSKEDVEFQMVMPGMLADTADVTFTVKNFGQSAAKEVKFFGHCTIGGYWSDRAETEELSTQARKVLLGDIAPGHEKVRQGYLVHGLANAYRDILVGTRSIFLEGQIQYGDIFGNKYVTNFQLAMTGERFMVEPPNVTNYWNSAT